MGKANYVRRRMIRAACFWEQVTLCPGTNRRTSSVRMEEIEAEAEDENAEKNEHRERVKANET